MADIKAIKGTDNVTYNLRDDYSKGGGENLLLNIPRSHVTTNYDGYYLNMVENLTQGEIYTIQLGDVDIYHSAKTAAQTGIGVYGGGGSIHLLNGAGPTYGTAGTNNYHANYLKATFTAPTTTASGYQNSYLVLYNSVGYVSGTMKMEVGKGKLERGHKATDGSPCHKDIFTISGTELICNL